MSEEESAPKQEQAEPPKPETTADTTIPQPLTTTLKTSDDKAPTYEDVCEYKEEAPFEGIFNRLTTRNSGNPHVKGVIYISASSTLANHPHQVIDMGWTSHWVSDNQPDQWIRFDFKTSRLLLTHYTLKTYNYVAGGNHLRSWVVEGSHNDNDWEEIDRRQSTSDLNDRSKSKTYQCKSLATAYRFIRIMQTGKSHCNSDIFALSNVEFFGTLKNSPSSS